MIELSYTGIMLQKIQDEIEAPFRAEIDLLRAELAAMREKNETLQAVINAVAENLAQNDGKWLHITFQQMVFAYSTNVGGMED